MPGEKEGWGLCLSQAVLLGQGSVLHTGTARWGDGRGHTQPVCDLPSTHICAMSSYTAESMENPWNMGCACLHARKLFSPFRQQLKDQVGKIVI